MPLHYLTIAEAAEGIKSGTVTAVQLTEAYLARIGAANADLSAYITVTDEDALAQARSADAEATDQRWRGPLHGIPVALKDVIATRGVRTTCHSRLLIDSVPLEDATCVTKLKSAGAILLGKLSTHEFAFGGPSHDLPFPPARNPWMLDRSPGGSSSGSGAAVAAGLCAGALGSDTSGSIRMPAGNCGIVGMKPTYGRVSRRGLYPLSFSLDHVGPMARTVKDAAIMLQAIAGYDPRDPASVDVPAPDFTAALHGPLTGVRVGVARSWFEEEVALEVTAAMETMLQVLRDLGAIVFDVAVPSLNDLNACGRVILQAECYAVHRATLNSRPEDYGRLTRDRMRLGAFIRADHYMQAQRMRRNLTNSMMAVMDRCDVLVTANQYGPADLLSASAETFPFFGKPYFTMPFSVTGQPAMTVRCGYADNTLPIGFQIAGLPFDEATVFRVGHAYEQERGQPDLRPPI